MQKKLHLKLAIVKLTAISQNNKTKMHNKHDLRLAVMKQILLFHQAMAEMMAENYHNIWAKKKKMELEAKGKEFAYSFTDV